MPDHGTHAWSELATSDVDGAIRFFAETLGWTFQAFALPDGVYHVAHAGERPVAGIGGLDAGSVPGEKTPYWFHFVEVDDVDARITAAVAAGATIARAARDIPGFGRFATLRDPAGTPFGLMTSAAGG